MVREWVISSGVLFAILTVYFAALLYVGVRPDNGFIRWQAAVDRVRNAADIESLGSAAPDLDFSFMDLSADGCLGVLMALLVSIFLGAFVVAALWIGVNVVAVSLIMLFIPIYYTFRRGLRMVLIHSAQCQGRLCRSVLIAIRHAMFYSDLHLHGSLLLVDACVHRLVR